jgi:hypothetical protein
MSTLKEVYSAFSLNYLRRLFTMFSDRIEFGIEQRLSSFRKEREVQQRVEQLVLCGVRPKVIYQVMGKQVSVAEIRRIYDLISPLPPAERHGRNVKGSSINSLSSEAQTLYLECFSNVRVAMSQGASKSDALAAAWRIATSSRRYLPHQLPHGCRAEEMIVLFLNLEVGEISIQACGLCQGSSLFHQRYACVHCEKAEKRRLLAA